MDSGLDSIVDIFDSSLNLEDSHFNQGYSEGYADGLRTGKAEGREVGLKSGFETGEEIGFYRGCVDVWTSAIQLDPSRFSERVKNVVKLMDALIKSYPMADPENEAGTDVLESLRLKFRVVCANLKVKLEYDGYPKASNSNEL